MLDPKFLDALEALAISNTENWWRDVLGHHELVLAVRRSSINAYYRGASIFRIDWKAGQISPVVHVKYLVTPAQDYIHLNSDNGFELKGIEPLAMRYEGRETLERMIRASAKHSGAEKSGLHPMLIGNSNVIDTEVALTRLGSAENTPEVEQENASGRKADRIDAAIAVPSDGGTPEIRFFEAKHFTNGALRANGDVDPGVVKQVLDYEKALTKHAPVLSARYLDTAQALVRFNKMRVSAFGQMAARDISPTLKEIAETGRSPGINPKPHLIIYGFDKAQRDDAGWKAHLAKLETKLPGRVLAIGNPARTTRFYRQTN
jgi:hypothetical protein